MSDWTVEEMPDLKGKVIVVTGANSGIGLEAAREFLRNGARVIAACRSEERGKAACEELRSDVEGADVELMVLDLSDLESVKAFAEEFLAKEDRLDVLCNNAGLMAIPHRETPQGFEMQMGVNHFGHFALTGRLISLLEETPGSRVVTVSSNAHRMGVIRFEDLHWEKKYSKWGAYGQSKLANLLFAYELQRRLARKESTCISVACHPGIAHTELATKGPKMQGRKWLQKLSGRFTETLGQTAAEGALPTLYAAVQPGLSGGEYIGPAGIGEMKGPPKVTDSNDRSHDEQVAKRLWSMSEELTGVHYLSD